MDELELTFETIYFDNSNFNFLNKDVLRIILKQVDRVEDLSLLFSIYEDEVAKVKLVNDSLEKSEVVVPNTCYVNSNPWFELCKREQILRRIKEFKNINDMGFGNLIYPKELFRNDIQELVIGLNNDYVTYDGFNLIYEEYKNFNLCELKIFSRDRIEIVSKTRFSSSFDELKEHVFNGKLISKNMSGLNSVEITNFKDTNNTKFIAFCRDKVHFVQELENLKEIEEIISTKFEGKATLREKCLKAYDDYINNPTNINKHKLLIAYESIPYHNRRYLFEMGVDDEPIKEILYIFESESNI